MESIVLLFLPGPWFNIKMPFYQYRISDYGDKTILWPSYLQNVISYTGKMTSLYWFSPQASMWWKQDEISLSFALVQKMAWYQAGHKPNQTHDALVDLVYLGQALTKSVGPLMVNLVFFLPL